MNNQILMMTGTRPRPQVKAPETKEPSTTGTVDRFTPSERDRTAEIRRKVELLMNDGGSAKSPSQATSNSVAEPKSKEKKPGLFQTLVDAVRHGASNSGSSVGYTQSGEMRMDYGGGMSVYSNGDVTFGDTYRTLRDHGSF